MNRLFDVVKLAKPKTSLFDLSHERKMSLNMGDLVPVLVEEVVPGDKFKVNTEILMRLAPMVAPMMHRVNVYTHYFFVPNRLVYSEWENFITGGEAGTEAPAFPTFQLTTGNSPSREKGSLYDYMGLPAMAQGAVADNQVISALPFRAYQLIYNEYYRDQTQTAPVAITKDTTVQAGEEAVLLAMRKRCWEHDYFTSAMPWTQRGSEVLLPGDLVYDNNKTSKVYSSTGILNDTAGDITTDASGNIVQPDSGGITGRIETEGSLDVSINDLRRAARLQAWLERNALGGSRYVEQILAHFGVRLDDYRASRPVYLGGGKQNVVISEVLNTSATATQPQGEMAGHGLSVGNQNSFKSSFKEHGYIIGIMSVLPRTAYQQGIPKMYQKTDKFDYFFPEFANIGEQPIYKKELYFDPADATYNNETFGYVPRFAEYKYGISSVHGDFRDSLYAWHMGRIFSGQPELNDTFLNANPTHRVFAVTTESVHKLYCQIYHNIKAIRPMPQYGTPGVHII